MSPIIVGSVGVFFLLIAFFLNLTKKLDEDSYAYLAMNFVGAIMAAYYAYSGDIIPFVILEIVWATTALVKAILKLKKTPI